MQTLSAGNTALALSPTENTCPYLCGQSQTCTASFSAMAVNGRKRRDLCHSEDFDDCALFLSRLLRHSQPRYGLDPWTMQHK
ncbi:hypothetical protein [Geoalkalibacter sp.]|uniref:hypothetical protein n=1 Tax=Geoalkalibacter sp. TaxID=3041440 RepID=UPI00272E9FE7|nr:hypothetical protein [Geoalkalibacter sp.]